MVNQTMSLLQAPTIGARNNRLIRLFFPWTFGFFVFFLFWLIRYEVKNIETLHPNAEGHRIIAERIYQVVSPYLKR